MRVSLLALSPAALGLTPSIGVDLGNEYSKVVITSPHHKLDIMLNQQSGRKTRSAVRLPANSQRQFGTTAYNAQGQKPEEVFQYYGQGHTFSANAPQRFYPYVNDTKLAGEALLNYISSVKDLLESTISKVDKSMTIWNTELAATIPVGLPYRERQRYVQLLEAGGFKPIGLVPAPLAAAVSHTLDVASSIDKGKVAKKLMLDIGAEHIQACFVEIENVVTHNDTKAQAGIRASELTPEVRVVQCEHSNVHGTHAIDLLIAQYIYDQWGHSSESPRVHRTLLKLGASAKHSLSVASETKVAYENLVEGHDLNLKIKRSDFEKLLSSSPWFGSLQTQLKKWSKLHKFDSVELLGNGWRVPMLKDTLGKIFSEKKLSHKCNPDEAAVLGAGMIATNHSAIYKFKPIYYKLPMAESFKISFTQDKAGALTDAVVIPKHTPQGSSFVKRLADVKLVEDDLVVAVETEDGKEVYNKYRISGVDTARRMRSRSKTVYAEKRKLYDELARSNFTSSVVNSMNETVAVAIPEQSQWIEDDQAAAFPETLDSFNLTIKMNINANGLFQVRSASVAWMDTQVHENRKDHQVEIDDPTPTPTETTQTNEVESSSETQAKSAEEESSSTEASVQDAATPRKNVTVHSYTWTVTKNVKRSRSLSISEIEIETAAAEESRMVKPLPYTKRELKKLKTALHDRVERDRTIELLNEKRNSLESEIYAFKDDLRNWQSDELLDAEKVKETSDVLEAAEMWLYSDASSQNFTAVTSKMSELAQTRKSLKEKISTHPKVVGLKYENEIQRLKSKMRRAAKNLSEATTGELTVQLKEFEEYVHSQVALLTTEKQNDILADMAKKWSEFSRSFKANMAGDPPSSAPAAAADASNKSKHVEL